MRPGKLPHAMLAQLLKKIAQDDPRVIVGPRVGEDAAVIDFGDRYLVAKTDPITFATDLIGWYAVNVSANDIACMGAWPRWFLGTLLLPETAEEQDIAAIFQQLGEACQHLGVTPVGGHTEVTIGLDRPILIGCMLGEVPPDGLITSAGARPGDIILLSDPIAVEGTALLAREAEEALLAQGVARRTVDRARRLLFDPGISVVFAVDSAREAGGGITALHDPTEGGLATGLAELAIASNVGLEVEEGHIRFLRATRQFCRVLGLDPLGLIASGALVLAVDPIWADAVFDSLLIHGFHPARIGRALPPEEGTWIIRQDGTREPLPVFAQDELARFFDGR
jgi:hydrogenase expression/formation protein HypE